MQTGIYIDFSISYDAQKWFKDLPPPLPLNPKIGDMFMWKDWCGKYSIKPWEAKYYKYNGIKWTEIGETNV